MKNNNARREVLKAACATATTLLAGCATPGGGKPLGRVVVVGGGYGGATAAKYLRLWSEGRIEVTLVEANPSFISCPISNLVLSGDRRIEELTVSYGGLKKRGVNVVHDTVTAIDAQKKEVRLASGQTLPYDRIVVSPGVEFMYERVSGMDAEAQKSILHAWKAGTQTLALRQQLMQMQAGGTVVMSIPIAPYRCPPGPYERACMIASYLKAAKPRAKLVVLDGNPDVVSKKPLFSRVFAEDYKGIIEYHTGMNVTEVDARSKNFVTEIGDKIQGDVLNLIPPQRAANIARDTGLITTNERWCDINWVTMESVKVPFVHVLGDATLSAPAMPKSGHMANQHGKATAAAIVELMNGRQPLAPMMANTCYSYVDGKNAVHVTSVHQWVAEKKTMEAVPNSGGISSQERASWALEGGYAWGWAQTIWSDMLS